MKKATMTLLQSIVVSAFFVILPFNHPVQAKIEAKTILVVRKSGPSFEQVFEKMKQELRTYNIKDFVIQNSSSYNDFAAAVKDYKPQFFILMDNKSTEFGIQWNKESQKKIPGIALMGLNLQSILKNNKYISGVAFESPAYTLITQFRYYFDKPIRKVVVFYRKSMFLDIINQAREQLKTEKITLDALDVEQDGATQEQIETYLKTKGISYLQDVAAYDVVWCLVDSALLSRSLFTQFWIPSVLKTKMPIVTGVENLAKPDMNFAVFAVTPNLADLSSQSVQIVQRILEENESPAKIGVEQVISVDKVINKRKAKEMGLKLHEDRISDTKLEE